MAIARDTLALFRRRDFAFLMGAQWFAQAADGLVVGALAKFITFGGQAGFDAESAKSPEEAFRIVLFTFLPLLVLSPFLGVFIDRWNRRKLLVGANGLRALVLLAVAALGFATIGDPALYVILLLTLASTRLLLAIKGASLPATLGERDLIAGNAASQAGSALFQLGGAGVGLVASGLVPTRFVIAGGVVVYAVATAFALGTRTLGYAKATVPLREELSRVLRDIGEGLREVGRRPRAGLALASFLAVRSELTLATLAVSFAALGFVGERGLATVIPGAAGALGAVVGFVLAHLLKDRVGAPRIVVGALLAGGIGMAAFGGIITLLGLSLMAFSVGLAFFLGKVGVDTLMQEALADAFRGRGFSLQDVVYNLSWILPSVVLVLLYPAEGPPRALLIGSGAVFLGVAILLGLWARQIGSAAEHRPGAPEHRPGVPEPDPRAPEPRQAPPSS